MQAHTIGPISSPPAAGGDSVQPPTAGPRAAGCTRIDAASASLAHSNARLWRHVDDLAQQTDRLIAAALEEDWSEVRRVTEGIARASDLDGNGLLADRAWQVCEELDQPHNRLGVRRSIERLLGASGRESRRLPPPLLA